MLERLRRRWNETSRAERIRGATVAAAVLLEIGRAHV